ncbi:MAG TPA: FAD-linked oxidase C-terminal domain-containing protein [Bacteroidales bacterium]|nr:FAD-linked oxidase C-terminal domain-containing protein [Bacteroidales bacterium]
MLNKLHELKQALEGELLTDQSCLTIYATDASLYFDRPLAVAVPKNEKDLEKLIAFASANNIPLTPRAAGTSLAGQATGSGIIVDISKHFRKILKLNTRERFVIVQPGVVRDELNKFLEPYGLMFCPETSTSNRCMIGGMIGNNSCGEHSLIYGSTRDHLVSVKCILSDGSKAEFGQMSKAELEEKCHGDSLESRIYNKLKETLENPDIAAEIHANYPEVGIRRRNMGYALDVLLDSEIFNTNTKEVFNPAKLICGSEGTLAFITEVRLNLVPIPKQKTAFICAHFETLEQSLAANLVILKHQPTSVELIDKTIISLTKDNLSQQQNRFFIQGEPGAILIVELAHEDENTLLQKAGELVASLKSKGLGFHFPVITGEDMVKVRNLRKAGLGVLTTITTDLKPHSFVEDTAVAPDKLPAYMADFRAMLDKSGVSCAFYGHISTGELHVKPMLNLRTDEGVALLKKIAYETALLIKIYRGSLSGEHGDGRLRGEFIPLVLGKTVYQCLTEIKNVFDPQHIFNRGKIIESPCIAQDLREQRLIAEPSVHTFFDYSKTNGLLRAIGRCNGSADCRKSHYIGGLMCPSYMATLDEMNSTRARANLLREILAGTNSKNPFNTKDLHDILDLCLMCKGCKIECPSGIDMARYKAEFLQHYYEARHVPVRTRMIAGITTIYKLAAYFPGIFNFFAGNTFFSSLLKNMLGFSDRRQIPCIGNTTLKKWAKSYLKQSNGKGKRILFFADEFTNHLDVEIGKKAVMLLVRLGYHVEMAPVDESGRTYFSKGMLRKAGNISERNVRVLSNIISDEVPLVGIEPSAILSFRDEVPDIVRKELIAAAEIIARNSYTIEEFVVREFDKGSFTSAMFSLDHKKIKLHGHCHQKVLSITLPTKRMLEIPQNFAVEEIPSGCCGMAGSFGYEKEHYELSMKIGEMILFPAVKKAGSEIIISAPGTSCRQQIKDGTGKTAFHPVEVLFNALI